MDGTGVLVSLENLRSRLPEFLSAKMTKLSSGGMMYGGDFYDWRDFYDMNDLYDGLDFDEDDVVFPPPSKKKGKDSRKIYFYTDYHDESSKTEFKSLAEFKSFCDDEGYQIPLGMYSDYELVKNPLHCVVDPYMMMVGRKCIVFGRSYGEMYYEVCEGDEI